MIDRELEARVLVPAGARIRTAQLQRTVVLELHVHEIVCVYQTLSRTIGEAVQ
jgi:hypothetical protein